MKDRRVRVAIVGVVVIALFSALLGRLWFLQVGGTGTGVVVIAQNTLRRIQAESPRGLIVDANGVVLASDRVAWAVKVDRRLVGKQRSTVVSRLSTVTHIPIAVINRRIKDMRQSPFEPAVVAIGKTEVTDRVRLAILERQEYYPHVTVEIVPYRYYPAGQLAAHVLGYVGKVSGPTEAKKHPGYEDNDTIGRAGVEATYDSYLHGTSRVENVAVDPAGRVVGDPKLVSAGHPGDNVQLTIDSKIQKVAEESLAQGIALARTQQNTEVKALRLENYKAPGGSVVVLDANTGAVVAMASNPTYAPSEFVGGITQAQYDSLTKPPARLINRATQGLYPVGSTFKLVSSIAAVQNGFRGEFTPISDPGFYTTQDGTRFSNANGESHGTVDLRKALTVSSDVYFYSFGNEMWDVWKAGDRKRGYAIQTVAREFGFGGKTGIPIDESRGRVPDATWKQAFAKQLYSNPQQQRENGSWNPGDDIQLAVGQGDLVATPLQLADAYAAFTNGGTLYQPQLVSRIIDPVTDKVVKVVKPVARRHIAIAPQLNSALMDGFSGVVNDPSGTAYDAFHGPHPFPLAQYPVSGKTGTAQVVMNKAGELSDHSVFVGMVTAKQHQYVVVSFVEQAGRGATISAPIVRRVIEALEGLPLSTINTAKTGSD
ncbi:MAG: penicillin-binding protein 2 [Actinomycetota bacterium]|jgi:penicillin-binding protein 2|nr:penicillin-binding protein 2 [Actinomycetota bacterium]